MKLGSLKEGGRDGTLIVVSRDLTRAVRASGIAPTLQAALDDWSNSAPRLNALYADLNEGSASGAFALEPTVLAAPLRTPRCIAMSVAVSQACSAIMMSMAPAAWLRTSPVAKCRPARPSRFFSMCR